MVCETKTSHGIAQLETPFQTMIIFSLLQHNWWNAVV